MRGEEPKADIFGLGNAGQAEPWRAGRYVGDASHGNGTGHETTRGTLAQNTGRVCASDVRKKMCVWRPLIGRVCVSSKAKKKQKKHLFFGRFR